MAIITETDDAVLYSLSGATDPDDFSAGTASYTITYANLIPDQSYTVTIDLGTSNMQFFAMGDGVGVSVSQAIQGDTSPRLPNNWTNRVRQWRRRQGQADRRPRCGHSAELRRNAARSD